MATITINDEGIPEYTGKGKKVTGTYSMGTDITAQIDTGLKRIKYFSARSVSAFVGVTSDPRTQETGFPLSQSTVVLVASTTQDVGIWTAEGE